MPGVVPFIPLISAGLGLAGSVFGNKKGSTTQNTPQLPNQTGAANSALSGISGLGQNNVAQELLPQYNSVVQGLQNNPYSTQAQQGAGAAATQGATTAANAGNASSNLFGYTNSLIPYASHLGMAAFDPQQDLYNRTLQQVQDQQRVAQSRRGIDMTPYGAGLEGDATRNFNIDWQNGQLQRMISGIQALGGLGTSLGQGYNTAGGLGADASQLYAQSSQLPYATQLGQGQDQLTLLNALGNAGTAANAVPQQQIADLLQYLGQANAANQTATQASNTNFNQNQTLGSGLGNALSSFGNAAGQIDWSKLFGGGQASGSSFIPGYGLGGLY